MSKLDDARNTINEIDKQMSKLFYERMKAVETVAQHKKECGLPIFDKDREKAMLDKNSKYISDDSIRSYYIRFLQQEMELSKQYQESLIKGRKVSYSGVEGAFANIAAKRIFPYSRLVAYSDFKSAYDSVVSGESDCCVLPIENSYAGEVGQVMDLMFSGSLYVNGVYTLKISHNLLGVSGAKLSDIKYVISHPQALSQCANYIKDHGFESIEATNTARAAKQTAQKGDKTLAAIASADTAKLYNLEVLDHDINESDTNSTRFAVFSRVANNFSGSKDSKKFLLMFTVKNEAGALAQAINVIGSYGYNMKALRSRPMKELAWQYYFYVEAEGDETSENGKKMLEEIKRHCDKLKVVGHYSVEVLLKEDKK